MRFLNEFQLSGGKFTRVYRNAEWDEYVVRFYNHKGVHMDASDYHTSDKQDAYDTAQRDIE